MNRYWMRLGAALTAGVLVVAGCATDEYGNPRAATETEKGVGIGAVTGAALGALIADKSGKGAAIGAVGGALVGGLVGNYMEQQRRDFEKVLAPEIAIEEGEAQGVVTLVHDVVALSHPHRVVVEGFGLPGWLQEGHFVQQDQGSEAFARRGRRGLE